MQKFKLVEQKLPHGLIRYFTPGTDGGGEWMKYPLIDHIKKYGSKKSYNRCYEWCSGSAPMGFALLDAQLAKNLICQDSFDIAIQDCKVTAEKNNIQDKVKAYVSSSVSEVPDTELCDLVISNPPHCWVDYMNGDEFSTRILLDLDKKAHKEFFENIRKRITSDCDLFIIERNSDGSKDINDFVSWAEENGLSFVNQYRFTRNDADKLGVNQDSFVDQVKWKEHNQECGHYTWDTMHFRVKL